jgi:L-cysteine desulfidase
MRTFLSNEVKPALGCTEPGAVALAASWAAKHGGGQIRSIRLQLSPNIFKNGLRAGILERKAERGISSLRLSVPSRATRRRDF